MNLQRTPGAQGARPVVIALGPIQPSALDRLSAAYGCRCAWEGAPGPAVDAAAEAACEVLVTNSVRGASAADIARFPQLRLIVCFGVGVDAIDLVAAARRGVAVTNTPGVLTEDVADLALALLLGAIRAMCAGDAFVREGRWLKERMPVTRSLQGRKVGIVGLGRIGSSIAKRCVAFNTEVAYFGPRPKPDAAYRYFADVVEMATWADVLIAACSGGVETQGVISRQALEALGPDGVFVNIARGSVVDEPALVDLLKGGGLGAAGLDVFEHEPHVPAELLELGNVVLQPHQGSATAFTREAMGQLVLDNVAAFAGGRALITALPSPVAQPIQGTSA